MSYEVIDADNRGFTVWDGQFDPKWPTKKIGITFVPGYCPFQVGDRVEMIFRLVQESIMQEKISRCEIHNAFHNPGPDCIISRELTKETQ